MARLLSAHAGKNLPPIVKTIAFSPDGMTVATCGQDRRVCLWQAANGQRLREWQPHAEPRSLAFASDSRHLVFGNSDGTVYFLRLESARMKASSSVYQPGAQATGQNSNDSRRSRFGLVSLLPTLARLGSTSETRA